MFLRQHTRFGDAEVEMIFCWLGGATFVDRVDNRGQRVAKDSGEARRGPGPLLSRMYQTRSYGKRQVLKGGWVRRKLGRG
jgi:hypothetical protein